jgi:phenylacetate-CoA ligase
MKYALSRKNIWEKAPNSIKRGIGLLLRRVPPKLLLGKKYRDTYEFLNKSQWWSRDQIEAYQIAELSRVCKHAYENSRFYKQHFEKAQFNPYNIQDLSDISKLPLIDRDIINNNIKGILTASIHSPDVDYITTGGTTGAPLTFYTTSKRSQIELAYLHAGWERAGYKPDITMAVLRGRKIQSDKNGLYHEFDPLLRQHHYSSFHLYDDSMRKYVEHISTIGDCYFHVYPSSIAYLTRFLRRSGTVAPSNIKGIIAESENVYPEQRQMVEEVFGVRYFSSYGHTEKLVQASECEYSTNYHIWPTYGFFELVDESGAPVKTHGQVGEIVGTGFINHVMPFIRYRTGDFASYIAETCPDCGRNHAIVKDIRGHNIQEYLVANDGSSIPWSAVNMHDDTFDNILRFQFEQENPGFAHLNIMPTDNLKEDNMNRMIKNLSMKFGNRLDFDVKIVDDIPLTKSGKSVFVKQKIAPEQTD